MEQEEYDAWGYQQERKKISWSTLINGFGAEVLAILGEDPGHLPVDYNPITRALRGNDTFVSSIEGIDGFSRSGLARLAVACQMVVYDHQGGPDSDDKPKMIRRHWYAWFKTQFAQPFANQLEDYELVGGIKTYNDKKWDKLLSTTFAWYVDNAAYREWPGECPHCNEYFQPGFPSSGEGWCWHCDNKIEPSIIRVTYRDLWVKDDSRMIARIQEELYHQAYIIVAVEKDSLFNDIKPIAEALGARAIISGRGKNSKAATERILREYFDWRGRTEYAWQSDEDLQVFFEDKPLIILHLSDYDYDGEKVIGPTFAQQARRYTPHVLEARIGIEPRDIDEGNLQEVIYQVKVTNKGYIRWAEEKAIFWGVCEQGHKELIQGAGEGFCGQCMAILEPIQVGGLESDTAYGLEVEALPTSAYRQLLVWALLEVLEFEFIVQKIRENTKADAWGAAERVAAAALADNDDYQALVKELERYQILEDKRIDFEDRVRNSFYEITEKQDDLFDWEGAQPEVSEFVNHVVTSNSDWATPWRPFDHYKRTELLVEYVTEAQVELIRAWENERFYWDE